MAARYKASHKHQLYNAYMLHQTNEQVLLLLSWWRKLNWWQGKGPALTACSRCISPWSIYIVNWRVMTHDGENYALSITEIEWLNSWVMTPSWSLFGLFLDSISGTDDWLVDMLRALAATRHVDASQQVLTRCMHPSYQVGCCVCLSVFVSKTLDM